MGLDAGGSQTRWALAAADGALLAQGVVEGFSALQMETPGGVAAVKQLFVPLARILARFGKITTLHAGVTGFGGLHSAHGQQLQDLLVTCFEVGRVHVVLSNDIVLACRAVFAPGEGYLIYAGTGSIAGFVDDHDEFHRAGGRGHLLDDGGGGYWMTREALRRIWRMEDEDPGSWQDSPLAQALFNAIGGSDWAITRQWVYGRSRGELGVLARLIASCAESDPLAADILRGAGAELARLGNAMIARFGPRPLAVAGRAALMHPLVEASLRAHLPTDLSLKSVQIRANEAAARLAAARIA